MGVQEALQIAWVGPVPPKYWDGKRLVLPWCIGWHEINGLIVEEHDDEKFTCLLCGRLLAASWRHVCPRCRCTFVADMPNFPFALECKDCQ